MTEHTAGPNQIRGIAARLCWTHPGFVDFISKKDASDALHQYADEMEADTVRQAAPDLLEAAKAAVEMASGLMAIEPDSKPRPLYHQLRQAIAKAEGPATKEKP